YQVRDDQGKCWNARTKGVMRLDDITSTKPEAVEGNVRKEIENEYEWSARMRDISERANYINRQAIRSKNQQQIVAANIDQTLLLATLREPRTSQGFMDRFLVASEAYHVKPIIVFNKSDLYRKKEMDQFEHLKNIYEQVGYPVILISVLNNERVDEV